MGPRVKPEDDGGAAMGWVAVGWVAGESSSATFAIRVASLSLMVVMSNHEPRTTNHEQTTHTLSADTNPVIHLRRSKNGNPGVAVF
ncbi:hypothetical protein FHW17_001266 [Phyllobacterium sp. P30BS-XVII]|nr:hypothetical protein [Phyllobacterium sp. P30BS-XVII]